MAIRPGAATAVVSSYEDALYAEEDKKNEKRRPDLVVDRLYAKYQLGFWDVPDIEVWTGVAPFNVVWAQASPLFSLNFTGATRDLKVLAKGMNMIRIRAPWPCQSAATGGSATALPAAGSLWTMSFQWTGVTTASSDMALGLHIMSLERDTDANTAITPVTLVACKVAAGDVIAVKFQCGPLAANVGANQTGTIDFVLWIMDNE